MRPLTERDIRTSFVNCSRGEAQRINLPDLTAQPWDDLDYLGWFDPKAPQAAAIAVPTADGDLRVVRLRRNLGGAGRTRMCSLCCTTHPSSGVSLMVAPRAGKPGRDGNTVGLDVCADLRCSGYARGWLPLPPLVRVHETTSVGDRVTRLTTNLDAFVARVLR